MKTKTSVTALGAAVLVLLLTGCATSSTQALMDEPQVAEDALPDLPSLEGTIELVDSSSRLLGEAEGARFWAARDDEGLFCVLAIPIDAPEGTVISCGGDDGDGMMFSGRTIPSASWHADGAPEGRDGDTVLRGHLLVRAPYTPAD